MQDEKKKKLYIFLSALFPGGGYMYFGMMRKGALLMALFTALLGLTLTIGWKFMAFLLPVVWCYCFFDTFHTAKLTEAERRAADAACYEKVAAFCKDDPLRHIEGRRSLIGVLILLAALYTLIYGVLLPFFRWGEQFYWVRLVLSVIPTAVVAVLLLFVGRHILQKEQERKEAAQAEPAEEQAFAEAVLDATEAEPAEKTETM